MKKMDEKMDSLTAYKAMVKFIESYWVRNGKPDAIGSLLGDLSLETYVDESSSDPAALEDWQQAVKSVRNLEN